MKPKNLYYVKTVSDQDGGTHVLCSSYDNRGVGFFLRIPYEIGVRLEGRQLWVVGDTGDILSIHSWVPLPEQKE